MLSLICFSLFEITLFQDNRIVPGAGAIEIELARRVATFGEVNNIDAYSSILSV